MSEAARIDAATMTVAVGPHSVVEGANRVPLLQHRAIVALVAAALATLAFSSYSAAASGMLAAFMAVVLVVLAATDLERRVIPNRVVLPAAAVLLVTRVAVSPSRTPEFVLAALGAALAFLVPNLINGSAIGMGDVKLAMLLGAGLGWGVFAAITVSLVSMFPFAVGTLIRGGRAARKTALPFGPFLALGALVILIVPRLIGGS